MSIQTELTRITNAKSAIKTAIEGKGVTVPDGTRLDGMAALIAGIEAGGKIYVETVTFTSQTREYTINHNLGEKPNFFMAFCMDKVDQYGTHLTGAISCFAKGGVLTYLYSGTGNTGDSKKAYAYLTNISKTDKTYTTIEPMDGYSILVPTLVNNTTLKLGKYNTTFYFMAKRYIMICAVLDMEGTE